MGSVNESGWPKVTDPRFDIPCAICIQIQVKGALHRRVLPSHIAKSKMSNNNKQETDIMAKFRTVYGK